MLPPSCNVFFFIDSAESLSVNLYRRNTHFGRRTHVTQKYPCQKILNSIRRTMHDQYPVLTPCSSTIQHLNNLVFQISQIIIIIIIVIKLCRLLTIRCSVFDNRTSTTSGFLFVRHIFFHKKCVNVKIKLDIY